VERKLPRLKLRDQSVGNFGNLLIGDLLLKQPVARNRFI
jgi:hypothetical protein